MEAKMGKVSINSRGLVNQMSFHSKTYPHLTPTELKKLEKILNEGTPINWEEVIEPSNDPDPLRAKAINGARIKSAQRYQAQGGPKFSRGSNAKKPKTILPEKRVKAIRDLHRKK